MCEPLLARTILALRGGVGTTLPILLACAPILVHTARPDRNAYLDHTVTSVAGLLAEIRKDPQVADRYMRHFGMTRKEVLAMFSKLHVARLDHDIPVKMYSVPAGGYIKVHNSKLRKGELVFEDVKGRVVLKLKCGNPVIKGRLRAAIDIPSESTSQLPALRPLTFTQAPSGISGPIAETTPPQTPADVTVRADMPVPVERSVTSVTTTAPVPTITSGSSSNLAALLVAIPILAAAGISIHSSPNPVAPPPPPTPEPMSILLLSGAASGLLLYRRRQART